MLLLDVYKIPIGVALGVTAGIIATSIVLSLLRSTDKNPNRRCRHEVSLHLRRWFRQLEPRVLASLNGPLLIAGGPGWTGMTYSASTAAAGAGRGHWHVLRPDSRAVAGGQHHAAVRVVARHPDRRHAGHVLYQSADHRAAVNALAWQIGQWVLPQRCCRPSEAMATLPLGDEPRPLMGPWAGRWPGLPLLGLGLALLAWLLVQALWLATPVYRWLCTYRRFVKADNRPFTAGIPAHGHDLNYRHLYYFWVVAREAALPRRRPG